MQQNLFIRFLKKQIFPLQKEAPGGWNFTDIHVGTFLEIVVMITLWFNFNHKTFAQSAGFEPARAEPNRFLVYRLNHSATIAYKIGKCDVQVIEEKHCWKERNWVTQSNTWKIRCASNSFLQNNIYFNYWNVSKNNLSEVGFEPTPGEPDCDLNAAP